MGSKIIRFTVRDNTNIYRLELAKTLLYFIEYDFTYFWEQCIDAGRNARKTGRLPLSQISNAKNIISKAHPYIEACIGSDFAGIVTDCIIEYICQSDRITLDELWGRCISSKNQYENAIFKRISEYKTNRAINQWFNIVRIQEYARNKLSFIFDPDESGSVFSNEILRTRREYFDLACSLSANEMGYPCRQLPSVKVYNAASLPNSSFVIGKVAKAIYRRYSEVFANAAEINLPEAGDYSLTRDKLALDAYSYVKGMTRPAEIDMKFTLEAILENPEEVFLPDSLKAVIDLEFDLMYKEGISIRKCENCHRYFSAVTNSIYCDRVNSSGKTCRQQHEALNASLTAASGDENDIPELNTLAPEEKDNPQQPAIPSWRLVPPPNKGVPVPKEMEKHGQRIYNALYKRLGKGMEENEFKEWSQYLSNMKRNVKTGDSTVEQLEDFLNYSDKLVEAVKAAVKNKNTKLPVYYKEQFTQVALSDADSQENSLTINGNDYSEIPVKPLSLSQTTSENPYTESDIKPFMPEAFASLEEAINSEHSDKKIIVTGKTVKKEKKAIEIKEPSWERMTKEEAYARQAEDLYYEYDENEDEDEDY